MQLATMSSGLQRRLLLLLPLVPLCLLAGVNAWFDYHFADAAALQQDRRLPKLVPLLADSVIANGQSPGAQPVLLMAPVIAEFQRDRLGLSAFCIADLGGQVLLGHEWLRGLPPDHT